MPAKDRRHSSFWHLYFDLGIACIFCVININNNKGMSVEPFVVCVFYKDKTFDHMHELVKHKQV